MIRKVTVIAAIMIVLLLEHWAEGGVSLVMNGSFENDGEIGNIALKAPHRWCDVNVPADKFGGYISTDWATHSYDDGDGNCLTFYAKYDGTFDEGDMAMVSQQVYLEDVNKVLFDIEFTTDWPDYVDWDPEKFSAILVIDKNDIVWDSNTLEISGNGEYLNQACTVDGKYKDANLHTLSLGIKANASAAIPYYISYLVRWDFVKFDTHCGGFGYLPEDLNRDCYIDMNDLKIFAGQWLEDASEKYDFFQDGDDIVNYRDFAIFGEGWMDNTDWRNWLEDNCYELELLASDLNDDGIVNLGDFAILVKDWASEGDCIRGDINRSGMVDYEDVFILVDEWLLKSWLYGLE